MYRIVLFGKARPAIEALISLLAQQGHAVSREDPQDDPAEALGRHRPQAALADAVSLDDDLASLFKTLARLTAPAEIPVLVLVDRAWLAGHDVPRDVADFLCLPAEPAEVGARLRRLIWPNASGPAADVIQVGPLAIDQARHEILLDGRPLDLTLREYDLLAFLASHPGRVYSREALLDRVWGLDYLGGTRTVDVHVRRLRVKLDDEVGQLLQTVRGVGYRLNPPEDPVGVP